MIEKSPKNPGLPTHLRFGKIICECLAPTRGANDRQPYRKRVAKQFADRIGRSYSWVNRHQNFAEQYASIEDFEHEYPNVYSWHEARDIVARNNKQNDGSSMLAVHNELERITCRLENVKKTTQLMAGACTPATMND